MAKPNWGSGISGGISGAATGGSMFGPPGAIVGGVTGFVGGLFGGGKKKKPKRRSTLDPQQQSLYNDYISSIRGDGPFSGLYNFDANAANQNFDQMYSRPAYRNFQENVIPGITGQFRGNNLMNSSYAGEALARAGRNVQEGLDAHRSNMIYQGQQKAMDRQQSSIDNILGMQTFAMDPGEAKAPGPLDSILGSLSKIGGEKLADYISNYGSGRAGTSGTGNGINAGNLASNAAMFSGGRFG